MVGCWKIFINGSIRILLFSAKAKIRLLDEKTLLSLLNSVLSVQNICFFGAERKRCVMSSLNNTDPARLIRRR